MKGLRSILFFAIVVSFACVSNQVSLQRKYPYARLTQDYGILNDSDLLISEETATPVPFSRESISYPYWKCFPTSQLTFGCTNLEKDDMGVGMVEVSIRATSGKIYDEYVGRHGLPLETCQKEFVTKWQALTRGEKETCIAGSYVGPEADGLSQGWIFDRLRTKAGCNSYFEGDCKTN
jgi:hypothetical protein